MIILHLCRGDPIHRVLLLRLPRDNLCTQAAINTQCREDGGDWDRDCKWKLCSDSLNTITYEINMEFCIKCTKGTGRDRGVRRSWWRNVRYPVNSGIPQFVGLELDLAACWLLSAYWPLSAGFPPSMITCVCQLECFTS